MNLNSNRWVLLHHQVDDPIGDRGDHFDLMLSPADVSPGNANTEQGDLLLTWAIPANPLSQKLPLKCSAERLLDHRTIYLDYEGPISGDRGRVHRVASGTYEVVSWAEERIELRLQCNDNSIACHRGPYLVSLIRKDQTWELCWSGRNREGRNLKS